MICTVYDIFPLKGTQKHDERCKNIQEVICDKKKYKKNKLSKDFEIQWEKTLFYWEQSIHIFDTMD